jgi:nicotinamidase-related amidase
VTTALIVIDAQKIYTDRKSELFSKDASKTVKNINLLIDAFKKRGQPILFVRHVHKLDGSDLGRMFDFAGEAEEFNFKEGSAEVDYDDNLNRPAEAPEIVKNRYSAFVNTELDKRLRKAEVDTVVICGFMTNFCCESTARDAHDRDYFVDFVVDATGTPGTEKLSQAKIRKVVGELLAAGYARVSTTKRYVRNLGK